ncbi:hypothetical protein BC936DRAFT_143151 [Jimgerdemannia flammicorona]|uniref:C2 NT-type domain-containing protein n=1 Tax=Jimgerdemannia flammicorona TaxID=994334 RepID=A0A433DE79_9FUNG|nr:hypothetical protein BC936DRAFT_143151 [Jimgerdemannia flammicorona]
MHLTHIFVPKNRRVDFELHIRVHDLTSIPLVTGFYSIKWRLKHASVTYGATNRAPIKNHAVQWDVNFDSIVHLVIGKDGLLQPCELRVDVIQELNGGRETENIGNLVLNLSEYVGTGITTRRYLLQDSKINSKMKVRHFLWRALCF